MTEPTIVPGSPIPFAFKPKTDREELAEVLASHAVSPVEFEALFGVQSAMRMIHQMYVEQIDKTITPEQFLELTEHNASLGFRGFKAILGADRYRAVFGLDETDNILPIDKGVFMAEHAKETT